MFERTNTFTGFEVLKGERAARIIRKDRGIEINVSTDDIPYATVFARYTVEMILEQYGYFAGIDFPQHTTDIESIPLDLRILVAKTHARDCLRGHRSLRRAENYKVNRKGMYLCGGVHVKEGDFLRYHKERFKRQIQEKKRPSNASRYVGVEIEFLSPLDFDDLEDKLIDAGLGQFVQLTDDGSINSRPEECSCEDECYCDDGTDEFGIEVRVLAPRKEIHSVIEKLCKVLQEIGARVNYTCGLHVHLDMRRRCERKAFKNLTLMQPLLYRMVPSSRMHGQYSAYTNYTDFDDYMENADRYVGINGTAYDRHSTIEVRIHSGTINAEKINRWIELLSAIAYGATLENEPSSLEEVARVFKLSSELVQYIIKRLKKFKSEHSVNQYTRAAEEPKVFHLEIQENGISTGEIMQAG